jgi:hypothetical protein
MHGSSPDLALDATHLISELSGSVHANLARASTDVEHVVLLLDQSVEELVKHFMTIHQELQALKVDQSTDKINHVLSQCEQEINSIVTDMQFHDIANQLLGRVHTNLLSIQNLMKTISGDAKNATLWTDNHGIKSGKNLLLSVQHLIPESFSNCNAGIADTLGKTPMSGGDIELF